MILRLALVGTRRKIRNRKRSRRNVTRPSMLHSHQTKWTSARMIQAPHQAAQSHDLHSHNHSPNLSLKSHRSKSLAPTSANLAQNRTPHLWEQARAELPTRGRLPQTSVKVENQPSSMALKTKSRPMMSHPARLAIHQTTDSRRSSKP